MLDRIRYDFYARCEETFVLHRNSRDKKQLRIFACAKSQQVISKSKSRSTRPFLGQPLAFGGLNTMGIDGGC